jgi:beta-glucanase (GH16 family)
MKCRSCGAEIAANALICYKCGTATAEAKIKPPARRAGLGRGTIAGLILLGWLWPPWAGKWPAEACYDEVVSLCSA